MKDDIDNQTPVPALPVHQIFLVNLKARIYRNGRDAYGTCYKVEFSALHNNGLGDWTEDQYFKTDELLTLQKLSDWCHDWISQSIRPMGMAVQEFVVRK